MKKIYSKLGLTLGFSLALIFSCTNNDTSQKLLQESFKTGTKMVEIDVPTIGNFNNASTPKEQLAEFIDSKINQFEIAPDGEVISRRDRSAKHYLKEDGKTIDAIISPVSVHYKNEFGEWKDISTDLITSSKELYILENVKNNLKTWFPKDPGKVGIKITTDMAELYSGENLRMEWIDEYNSIIKTESANYESFISDGNEIKYQNIFIDVDNQYLIDNDKLKHNYILKAKPQIPNNAKYLSFSEQLTIPDGWNIKLYRSQNQLIILNKNNEVHLQIPFPLVYEENNQSILADTQNTGFKLFKINNNTYEILTQVSIEWLKHRNYPVVIDPTIILNGNNSGFIHHDYYYFYRDYRYYSDYYIRENKFYTYNSTNARIALNYYSSYSGTSNVGEMNESRYYGANGDYFKGWIKYNTSTIPDNSLIESVEFSANIVGGYEGSLYTHIYSSSRPGPYSFSYSDFQYNSISAFLHSTTSYSSIGQYPYITLESDANQKLQDKLSSDYFQIGLYSPLTHTGSAQIKSFDTNASIIKVTYQNACDLPVANCSDLTVNLDNTGNASIIASDVDNGSIAECGLSSMTVSPNTFTCSDVGPNTVTLTVTDVNNNVSTCTATVTVVDDIDPVAIAQDVTVHLDENGAGSTTAASVDNGSNDACGIALLALSQTEFDCSHVGANTVTLTVTDNNGNVSTATAVVTVEDNVDPVAVAQDVTVHLDENGAGSTTAAAVDNGSNDACGIASLVLSQTEFDCSHVGANTVTLRVTDNNGNVSTATAVVTVEDNVDPVAVAQDVTIQLDASGNGSTTAADVDNGSSDACGIALLALSQAEFDCSHVGANTVTLTVTDNNGNVSTATATVTVEDNVAPEALVQNVTVQLDENGEGSTTADDVDNGSNDACSIASLALSQAEFDCSHVGANTVTLTVTDNNGNVSTATATVTVEDNVAPEALAQNVTVQLDASGNGSTMAADVDNGSNDACGIALLELSQAEFDCSHVGVNTVTLTVTDNNGNVSTATATVTVEDNIDPVAVAQDVTVQLDASGNGSTTAEDVDNGSSDACGIALLELSQKDFDCSHVGINDVTLTVTDNNGNVSTASQVVTVIERPTTLTINNPVTGVYSDEVILSATLTDDVTSSGIAGMPLTFDLGTQTVSGTTGSDGTATASLTINQAPGSKTYSVAFAGDCPFEATTTSGTFTVEAEQACYEYTGPVYSATSGANSSEVTLVLSATVYEMDDLSGGDISNATVQFYSWDTPIGGTLVPEVDPNDPTIGYVSLEHTFDIGNNSSAENYEISLGINGYYTGNVNCSDATIINIYKPEGDFITGGGFIIEENSYGAYAADDGRKTNFGFNVKFNKKGTNLRGKMTIIVRRLESDGIVHIYRFKTNATESLGISLGGEGECDLAEFTSKANLTDVTDPLNPIEIMGNLQLRATLTDCGEPGSNDQIGVTIWSKNTLMFSSNWNGVETIEQLLDGGNLKVQSGFSLGNNKSGQLPTAEMSFEENIDINVYPNPSRGPVTLDFGSTQVQHAEVIVLSLTGAELFRKEYKLTNKVQLDMSEYISGMYTIRMNLDGNHFMRKLILKHE